MSKITILGGCGAIGSMAAKTIAAGDFFDEVVIAENRYELACELAESLDPGKVSAVKVDAGDPDSLGASIRGSTVVLNCIGPYYKFGPPVLKAAIDAGIDYVDVCDDLDATEAMLEMDADAQDAGISALMGMGNSPGMANVIARWCADNMLSKVEEVNIYHVHGGEPVEGPAVIKHRIHAMTSDIPLFVDGEFITVRMLEESGLAHVEEVEFKEIGTYPVYPYPHPETITIPRYLEGVKKVTNKGFVLPPEYFQMTMDAVKLGICMEEPLSVQSTDVIPIEFAVAFIISKRPGLLEAAGLDEPTGCLKVVVKGEKDGEPHTYEFSMFSKGAGAGEGTGIPAAMGAILMSQGKVTGKGVLPPEAGIDPTDFLALGGEVISGTGMGDSVPLYIDHIDKDGKKESIEFKL